MKHFKNNEKKPLVKLHYNMRDCVVVSPIDISLLDINPKSEEIIVDILTGQSVLRGSHVFAPGIMAMPSGNIFFCYNKFYINVKKVLNCIYLYVQYFCYLDTS